MATAKETRVEQPKSPMPEQSQERPGIESLMDPLPNFLAPNYKGSEKLAGKKALITGGDSGIGRAVATLYAREGADVAIIYLPVEQSDAEETVRHVEQEGRTCVLIPGDVKDATFCRSAVDEAVKQLVDCNS